VNRPLLILRPEPGNSATRAAAQALGLDVLSYPLFEVRPLDWDAPDAAAYTGLLLTSANAVRMAGENLAQYADVPVFAVGSAAAVLRRYLNWLALAVCCICAVCT
jgi:uroporphyrinogen-III synthase